MFVLVCPVVCAIPVTAVAVIDIYGVTIHENDIVWLGTPIFYEKLFTYLEKVKEKLK